MYIRISIYIICPWTSADRHIVEALASKYISNGTAEPEPPVNQPALPIRVHSVVFIIIDLVYYCPINH